MNKIDYVVHIPPKRRHKVEIEIRSIKKGEPVIVVPKAIRKLYEEA